MCQIIEKFVNICRNHSEKGDVFWLTVYIFAISKMNT